MTIFGYMTEVNPLKFTVEGFGKIKFSDGWMTCDFTSFSTIFQSYQDDWEMILKGCVQWNPVYA